MRAKLIFALVLPTLLVTLFIPTAPTSAAESTQIFLPMVMGINGVVVPPPDTGSAPASSYADEVIALTNAERAKAGCPALMPSVQLTNAAQGHTSYMASTKTLSHTGANNSSPWDRIRATGYQYSAAAENIAMGYSTPEAVMQGWMNSSAHRSNILNCGLREIGVGYATSANGPTFWTQDFGTPR